PKKEQKEQDNPPIENIADEVQDRLDQELAIKIEIGYDELLQNNDDNKKENSNNVTDTEKDKIIIKEENKTVNKPLKLGDFFKTDEWTEENIEEINRFKETKITLENDETLEKESEKNKRSHKKKQKNYGNK
ncbi:hypothetical protein, partial [Caldisalinibacter kiritimatiensis]|uniref:hypothetical protein n=1 Tax=Caldisalinibacter kiritimatiensis TaxID=1304284 RepID=UPI00054F9849